jgi:hypothetical protein
MKKDKPILQILADQTGVYEVGIRALAKTYGNAERLSAALKPAIDIIDGAIAAYAESSSLRPSCGAATPPPHSQKKGASDEHKA